MTPPADPAAAAAAAARDERTLMVPVGGLRLRVSVRPGTDFPPGAPAAATRPPLLLCNGIGAPIEMWPPFRDPLGRPTIAFDARSEEHTLNSSHPSKSRMPSSA